MNRDDLLRALAALIALERPRAAAEAAAMLPESLDIVDVLRAGDGVQQLARALDAHRRDQAA
jgi:hypothetical protein